MAKVFYSWQSDLPNKTNRGLVADALDKATKAIRDDDSLQVEPVVDRDTAGVGGSPDIGATIFAKIEQASVFVCDVSIVNAPGDEERPMPNPNVLIELGYAAKALGWGRVLMVVNSAFGAVEQLPFDLRLKRAVVYCSAPEDTERGTARAHLARVLEEALRMILAEPAPTGPSPFDMATKGIEYDSTDRVARTADYMAWLSDELSRLKPTNVGERPDDDQLVDALKASIPLVEQFARLGETIVRHAAIENAVAVMRGFEKVLQGYSVSPRHAGSFRQTDFDFHTFVGHELFVILASALLRSERFDILEAVLNVDLCIDTNHGRQNQPWTELSKYCALLDQVRIDRLKLGTASVRADLLKERHRATHDGRARSNLSV